MKHRKHRKSYFVGIAGPSGSGKTTLCKRLKLLYKDHEHIRLDNYFKSPKAFPKKAGFYNWELPTNLKFKTLLQHLDTLKNGKKIYTKTFPKKKGGKSRLIILKPKKIILVEGFMLFKNKKVRDALDLKIYLDVDPILMLKRRALRFGLEHVGEYDAKVAIPEFLKYGVTQKKYADHVINASKPQPEVIKKIKNILAFLRI